MGEADFQVNLETLAEVSRGVRGTVGSLTEMGDWGSELGSGRGQGLTYAVSNLNTGHDALAAEAESAGEAWDYGLRHQVKDGEAAAKKLDEAVAHYREIDREGAERLGQILAGGGEHGQQ